MGMGEPLNKFRAGGRRHVDLLDDFAYGLSRRRVTLSTPAWCRTSRKLKDALPVALAVSLHAPNDEIRSRIMPVNDAYPIAKLLGGVPRVPRSGAARLHHLRVRDARGVNDAPDHARELASC